MVCFLRIFLIRINKFVSSGLRGIQLRRLYHCNNSDVANYGNVRDCAANLTTSFADKRLTYPSKVIPVEGLAFKVSAKSEKLPSRSFCLLGLSTWIMSGLEA